MPLCERYLPKDFCKKCRRVAAACLCVTAVGVHDVLPHTHQENAPPPARFAVGAALSTSAVATGRGLAPPVSYATPFFRWRDLDDDRPG
jgi:hypothetical protein